MIEQQSFDRVLVVRSGRSLSARTESAFGRRLMPAASAERALANERLVLAALPFMRPMRKGQGRQAIEVRLCFTLRG